MNIRQVFPHIPNKKGIYYNGDVLISHKSLIKISHLEVLEKVSVFKMGKTPSDKFLVNTWCVPFQYFYSFCRVDFEYCFNLRLPWMYCLMRMIYRRIWYGEWISQICFLAIDVTNHTKYRVYILLAFNRLENLCRMENKIDPLYFSPPLLRLRLRVWDSLCLSGFI